jgi:dipeptidyl-peptidase-4
MSDIAIEEIAAYPLPGMVHPTWIEVSPDGNHLTFLDSMARDLTTHLYAMDLITGLRRPIFQPTVTEEADLPLEEKLRRERLRERGLGVTRYRWSRGRIVVPLAGGVWVQEGISGEARELLPRGEHAIINPTPSPDGRTLAFVMDGEVYTVPMTGGQPTQQSTGARGTGRTHGLAEYIAQEEMSRMRGFWWSPDSRRIALVEVDETHIPPWRITHHGAAERTFEEHAYPFAGEENARVRLGVITVGQGPSEPTWLPLAVQGESQDIYLARVYWGSAGLIVALQDRSQRRLELVRLDPATGARQQLLVEESGHWINLHHLFHAMPDGGFLWGSERTGFMHLYRYTVDGECIGAVTEGEWMVDTLEAVSVSRDRIYFTATKDDARQRHLYAAPLSGGEPRRLTEAGGLHSVTVDLAGGRFVDLHHSLSLPPTVTLRGLSDGHLLRTIHAPSDPRIAAMSLPPPEEVTLRSRDGVPLHGVLYRPEGPGPWPTVISVYGGPHAQRVQDGWHVTVDLRAQYFRQAGFAVFKLDNRGSARRGLAFEGAIRWDMGNIEVQDQVDGVRWLIDQGIADPARVGVFGWSYGGYMAAMCLARAPEVFAAAVAGAPVIHWDTYDTHYTERYMGRPQDNPEGYERSSVLAHVAGIRGRLMLVHGLIDENVLFRHTARMLNALIRHRIDHRLLLFPDERHMPRGEQDRIFMEEQILGFFQDALR